MKRMTLMIALLAVGMMTAAATAEDEKGNRRAGGKARAAGERPEGGRPGGGRPEGGRPEGGRPEGGRPGAGGQDPAKMVAAMLERFDKDGDQKLDKTELTALFKSMQERRGGGQAGAAGRKPGAAGKRGAGEGRRGGGEAQQKGGVRPERPKAE